MAPDTDHFHHRLQAKLGDSYGLAVYICSVADARSYLLLHRICSCMFDCPGVNLFQLCVAGQSTAKVRTANLKMNFSTWTSLPMSCPLSSRKANLASA